MDKNNYTKWLHNPLESDNILFYHRRNGIAVEHMYRPASYNMRCSHCHPDYEIYFLISGKRRILFDNHSYEIEAGTLVLIDSNQIHMTLAPENDTASYHERTILYISKERLEEYDMMFPELEMGRFFQQYGGIYSLSAAERQRTLRVFELIKQELGAENDKGQTMVDLIIIRFFINFWRSNRPTAYLMKWDSQQKKGKSSMVQEVSEHISAHFCEQITLKNLAEKFFVSESYLSRCFKEVVGVGIREYANLLRIQKAQELLEDPQLSVSEIAKEVGFESTSYFGRVFQKHLAISPSQYRKDFSSRNAEDLQNPL